LYDVDNNAYRVSVATPEGKRHLENVGIHDRIILKWILKKYNWKDVDSIILLRMCISGNIWCTQ
jgi:hypothetical protein